MHGESWMNCVRRSPHWNATGTRQNMHRESEELWLKVTAINANGTG